jgi:hypothetical protein
LKFSSGNYGGFPTPRCLGLASRRIICSRPGQISGNPRHSVLVIFIRFNLETLSVWTRRFAHLLPRFGAKVSVNHLFKFKRIAWQVGKTRVEAEAVGAERIFRLIRIGGTLTTPRTLDSLHPSFTHCMASILNPLLHPCTCLIRVLPLLVQILIRCSNRILRIGQGNRIFRVIGRGEHNSGRGRRR